MGLDAQEQLTKSYKARDVQNGGRCEVVKLESVELQEPPEKQMYWKFASSYQIRDKAYPLSFGRIGDALRLLSALIGGESGSNRNHEGWGKKSLGLEHH